ncbi:MAG: porin family protein [Gammaproteobacteria bacterium]
MIFKKTQLALGIATATLTVAGALVSPQALAGKAERIAEATSNKVDALEAQLRAMQAEIDSLRAASAAPADSAKVQELDQWMQQVKSTPVKEETKDNMVFFRGGWADMDHSREGVSIASDSFVNQQVLGGTGSRGDDEGFYIGAGFDFSLNDDLFGAMDNTEVLAELMFEWKDYGQTQGNLLTDNDDGVSVSQITISAAPKIKFLKGSPLRPWIIPVGLAAHIISPPSEQITVFNPGIMFGGGADYHLWNNIYLGVDARYHLTSDSGDGVNTDGYTAGGYIGIGF